MKIRDKKQLLVEEHRKQLAPYNDKLMMLENTLLNVLNREGAESLKTKAGTAYKSKRDSVKVQDWDTALEFIMDHHLEHMLERRLSKSAVREYLEANGQTPPGVAISTELTVNIRRS